MRRNSTASRDKIFILDLVIITITTKALSLPTPPGSSKRPFGSQTTLSPRPQVADPSGNLPLRFHASPNGVELPRRAELFVLVGNEIGVCLHENFARRPEIELVGFVTEE